MTLFCFKEKRKTPLGHGGQTMKKHMFQWKNLFIRIFLFMWKLIKHLWKRKKMGKTYTRCWTLDWGIAEVSLPLWKRKYKSRDRKENPWRAVEQFLILFLLNNKGISHAFLKDRTFFFITFAKNFIIQITWNAILYHWHASPAINYGKLLVIFFF